MGYSSLAKLLSKKLGVSFILLNAEKSILACNLCATQGNQDELSLLQLIDFLGSPDRNRTCNYPLGGGCYIHLTTGPWSHSIL